MAEEGEGDISGRLRILKDFFDEFNFHPNKPPCFDDVRRPGGRRVTVPNALQKLHKECQSVSRSQGRLYMEMKSRNQATNGRRGTKLWRN